MFKKLLLCACVSGLGLSFTAHAEILAMMNYESKTEDSLKTLKIGGAQERREGIAIIDVDPESENFGRIVSDIPLPSDLVAHHIFYDRTMTKAYLTALGKGELRVMDMTANPYRMKTIEVSDCEFGEDVIFSEDNSTWYLTCMKSNKVIVGDVATDAILKSVDTHVDYPHGIGMRSDIDRLLVTNTVRHDLQDPGEAIGVFEASSMKPVSTHKLSSKESPSGEAPVEIVFVPGSEPAVAYITNMFGASLWTATWNPGTGDFDVREAFDFKPMEAGVALEIYFNDAGDRMYVTTGSPGQMHIFDLSGGAGSPELLTSIATAGGAHHVAFTRDWKYAFVQNALLNLPGMDDGAITVIDLEKQEVVASMDTLKNAGLNPNSIVLLPEWNHLAGH